MRVCTLENCNKTTKTTRLCPMHHYRFKKYGNPNVEIITTKRSAIMKNDHCLIPVGLKAKYGYAILDKEFAYLDKYKWNMNTSGYCISRINDKIVMMHHLVIGKPGTNLVTDHINRNTKDNRKNNLRHVTHNINVLNRGLNSTNQSGFNGIHWHTRSKAWRVKIQRNKISKDVGIFKNLEEAIAARRIAEKQVSKENK